MRGVGTNELNKEVELNSIDRLVFYRVLGPRKKFVYFVLDSISINFLS